MVLVAALLARQLFCAAGVVRGAVVVTPPLVESFELEERLAQRTGELIGLNGRVEQLRRVERALLSDHSFQRRVMQAQAAAAPRPDETRIAVADELHFDPRSSETAPAVVWRAPWYASVITMLDESPGLRRSVIWTSVAAVSLCVCFPACPRDGRDGTGDGDGGSGRSGNRFSGLSPSCRVGGTVAERGQGHPGAGMQGGHAPSRRRRPSRRKPSKGARAQALDDVSDAPSPTRGDCKASGVVRKSSTPVPQSGRLLLTTVPHRNASGGKGLPP